MRSSPIAIGATLSSAWALTKGAKWPIWAVLLIGLLILFPVLLALNYLATVLTGQSAASAHPLHIMLPIYFIEYLIVAPFMAGAIMVAIKHTRKESITAGTGFHYFRKYLPVVIVFVVVNILTYIPVLLINGMSFFVDGESFKFVLEILSSILSMIIYSFFILSLPLVLDKNYSPFKALMTSPRLAKSHWLKIFTLLIITMLYFLAAVIPLTLGLLLKNIAIIILGLAIFIIVLIWLIPLIFLIQALIYNALAT